jgi:hypothetical protein
MKSTIYYILALVVSGTVLARHADGCDHCARCGCEADCCKVCRLVCGTKKVPKITYECKCEDFCVPGPSEHCVVRDDACGCKKHIYTPTCAKVRTRKVLVKHETMEEVASYKWVVDPVCGACAGKCAAETAALQQNYGMAKRPSGDVVAASFQSLPADAPQQAAVSPAGRFATDMGRVLGPIFGQK